MVKNYHLFLAFYFIIALIKRLNIFELYKIKAIVFKNSSVEQKYVDLNLISIFGNLHFLKYLNLV